jgi:hypothetical protein
MYLTQYEFSSAIAGVMAMAMAMVVGGRGPVEGFKPPVIVRVRLSLRVALSIRRSRRGDDEEDTGR